MAFLASNQKPVAKVLIKADSQQQLDEILLYLDRAVSRYAASKAPSCV